MTDEERRQQILKILLETTEANGFSKAEVEEAAQHAHAMALDLIADKLRELEEYLLRTLPTTTVH